MSCLCAPTNHAGSFRCRLHRGTSQSWGGRSPVPTGSPSSPKPTSSAAPESSNSPTPVTGQNGNLKQVVQQLPSPTRKFTVKYNPDFLVNRTSEARQSRLSRVSVASCLEAPSPGAHVEALGSTIAGRNGKPPTLKLSAPAASASGAMLGGGLEFFKNLQMGNAILDVFGSGARHSRVEMSL